VLNVVATRWAVDSGVAARISRSFYEHLFQDEHPAAALRSAVGEIRGDAAFANPAFWAGFHVFAPPIQSR
jgi:CHAT domain-containing protein